jgi:hypothetical protein
VFATQLSIVIQRPFNVHFEFYTRDMKQILPSSTSQAAPFHQQQPSHPQASPTIQLPGQPPAFSASAAAASSGIGAPPSQSADLSSLLASQNLSASTFLSAPLSHPAGASAISPSMLLQPPAISLASSAELTSTILVEEMATDEDGYSVCRAACTVRVFLILFISFPFLLFLSFSPRRVVVPPPAVPLTVDEPFWLMVEMTSTPPYPLSIEHTNLAMVMYRSYDTQRHTRHSERGALYSQFGLHAEHHQRERTSGDLHVDPLQADGCAQPIGLC